jgi:hypothetical protein
VEEGQKINENFYFLSSRFDMTVHFGSICFSCT